MFPRTLAEGGAGALACLPLVKGEEQVHTRA